MRVDVIGTRGFPLIEGGVERHCEELYPRLGKRADITVYRRKPYVKTAIPFEGITFADLPSTRIKGFEAFFHSFIATCLALKHKPDIVHYHNIGPALFSPLLKLRSIPVVMTYHSPNYEHAKWGKAAKRLLMFSEKVALRNSRRVIFVNRYQMEGYPKGIVDKSVYIPNGVTKIAATKECDYVKRIGLEPGKYVLSVGRITPEKGFDTLIKAFGESGLDGYGLAIVGGVETEGKYKKELERIAGSLPVVFTGQLHDGELAQLYCNAALYVLASRNEGFPLALLEAMGCGLEVLAGDIPATRLIPLEASAYFPVDDAFELSRLMRERLEHTERRSYELDAFNWDEVARQTLSVYETALRQD